MKACSSRRYAMTLTEATMVIVMIIVVVVWAVPALQAGRRGSRGQACARNLAEIVQSCRGYSTFNSGGWPAVDSWRNMPSTNTNPFRALGGVAQLPRDTPSRNHENGTPVAPSRSLWVLVRERLLPLNTFICPESGDRVDRTSNVEDFHDFKGYGFLSYGYQMPYYLRHNDCWPHADRDPRMVLVADKGPVSMQSTTQAVEGESARPGSPAAYNSAVNARRILAFIDACPVDIDQNHSNGQVVRLFNSPNHARRGQNIGRVDGSVAFVKTPWAGVDSDNIYNTQRPALSTNFFLNIMCGAPFGLAGFSAPGYQSLGAGSNATTDSALFP